MFSVTHTTPERALRHLLRLQHEGEALLSAPSLSPLDGALWAERLFKYLQKISSDPETFERVIWRNMPTLSESEPVPKVMAAADEAELQKRLVRERLITLAGAIEQFEAQYEK